MPPSEQTEVLKGFAAKIDHTLLAACSGGTLCIPLAVDGNIETVRGA